MAMAGFGFKRHENSQQKRVFNDIFVILRESWPRLWPIRNLVPYTKVNQNYEYFQIILEKFVDEFNLKL